LLPIIGESLRQSTRSNYLIDAESAGVFQQNRPNRVLLSEGADINERDDAGNTALMWAVRGVGNPEVIALLVAEGGDVNAENTEGSAALGYAINSRNQQGAVALIEAGANPDGQDKRGRPYLVAAADKDQVSVVEALIHHGVDIDTAGSEALAMAVGSGHVPISARLLAAGVNPSVATARSGTSVLRDAAEEGNVELVRLLLESGADPLGLKQLNRPLQGAATRGRQSVVELLLEFGAPATPEALLSAMRSNRTTLIQLIMDCLEPESLEPIDAVRLLSAAEQLGDEDIKAALSRFDAVRDEAARVARREAADNHAAAREHARLLYARKEDGACTIGLWNTRSKKTEALLQTDACPEELFVSPDGTSVYIVDGDSIHEVSTVGPNRSSTVDLPTLDYRAWLDQMPLRPNENPDYLPSATQLNPIGVSRHDDGSLALLVSLWMPADDEYHYLFRHDGKEWRIERARWCDRWGCEAPISALDFYSTNAWSWPQSTMLSHPGVERNPFVTNTRVSVDEMSTATLAIDGTTPTLRFAAGASAHSDMVHVFGIELVVVDAPPKNLSKNQCLTSMAGRYLLVYEFFQGRFEVTDLGTGETVIDSLTTAVWID
jgi:ankyrin repeat protein